MPTADRPSKPYDIRERLAVFANDVVRLSQFLRTRDPVTVALIPQLVSAATSAAANAEEADDASSPIVRRSEEKKARVRT